ncbi:MAG: hypothetical protein PVI03_02655 [Candidatus Thorarchaeota archaeon]|jgi:hypothetical protein
MTGDFDSKQDPEDIVTYETTSETEAIKEEYRASARKNTKRGIVLILTPILNIIVSFLAPAELADNVVIGILVCTFFIAIVGVILVFYHGLGTSILLKGFDILARVGPPGPILARRYAIVKVNDVYLLAHGSSGHLMAVAFRGMPQITWDSKIKLPRAFYRWESRLDIAGAKMFRRVGVFSIPVSQKESISGEAVLYGAPYQPSRYNWNIPEFSRAQLMAIIEHVTEDANRLY